MSLTKYVNNRSAGMNVKHIIACDRDLHTPASHLKQQFCLALGSESEIESYLNWTAHNARSHCDAADLLRGLLGFGGC